MQRKVVRAFLDAGYRVTWVGPDSQYVPNPQASAATPECEYKLFTPSRNRLGRLLGQRLKHTAATVRDVDVYYAPEPDSARTAVALARANGAKVIFDIHELYDQSHIRNWAPRPLRPLASLIVRRIILTISTRCHLVIGVSEGVLDPYRTSVQQSMIVRNCAPVWFGAGAAAGAERSDSSTFRLMHGKSTAYNGTPMVLRALALASPQIKMLRAVMFQWFDSEAGAAQRELAFDIETLGLKDVVELRTPVQMDEMPSVLRSCDLGMISHGRLLAAGTQPNRLYEYMAIGLPILAPSYDQGIAPVIVAERCGLLVDFEDQSSVAAAIVHLANNPAECREMGRRAREAFFARHNWEVEVRPLLATIEAWFPGRSRA